MTRANPTTLEYQFEPEIERVCRRNRKESRAMADPPNNWNAANNNQIAAAGGDNPPLAIPPIQVQNRSIRDHLLPDLENLNPGIVTPEIQAAQFELKPVMFNMLNSIGQFGGSPHEDARQHLRSFIKNPESRFYVGNFNRNNNPYSNKHNPGWKQHPNFSWNNQRNPSNTILQNADASGFQQNMSQQQNQLPQQQPPSTSFLENSLNAFINKIDSYMAETSKLMEKTDSFINMTDIRIQSQEASLKSLETQVGQFAQMLSTIPQGTLPSNIELARGMGHEQCKVITTRSMTKGSDDAIQVDENEQPRIVEIESPEIATLTPYAISTQEISPEDTATSPHAVANSSYNAMSNEVSKGKEIRLLPPFSQRLRKQKYEYQFKKFLDILKQVHINLPLVEAIDKMSNYAMFLKDMVSKRTRLSEFEKVATTEGCMTMLHNLLPPKLKDSGSFTIPCAIGNHYVGKALYDLGASINLMPKSVFQRLGIGKARPTTVMLQLADRSYVHPEGKIEYILVRVDKFIFPTDFIVLDCEADENAPIILGRTFLATGRMLTDCDKGDLTIRVNDQKVTLNIFKSLKQPDDREECQAISTVKKFNFEEEDVDKILTEASKIEEAEFDDDEPQKVNWIVNRPVDKHVG
ncbi:hypothetical protein GQ457_08G026690 [Hibiscus cannabinus]